jgi:hypothetical protein
LKLLDYRVRHQDFDTRQKSLVLESGNSERVNVAEIIWFDWPNVIAKATA